MLGLLNRVQIEDGILDFVTVRNGPIDLNVAVEGRGQLILCVHGFPELWYSWRQQIAHFSRHGYKVAALDVRGYGDSSKPREIAAYSIRQLASDTAAAIFPLCHQHQTSGSACSCQQITNRATVPVSASGSANTVDLLCCRNPAVSGEVDHRTKSARAR
jgi:hypothetical protein